MQGPSAFGEETQPLTTPALSTAFSTGHAQKGFWDYFSQSSGDKGRAEQTLAWEPV